MEEYTCDSCGGEAKYQMKNGKWCCESMWKRCPESRRKHSLFMKEHNPMFDPIVFERYRISSGSEECNEKRRQWTLKNNPMNKSEVREKHKKKMKTLSGKNNPLYTNPNGLENLRKAQRSPEMREKRLLIGSRLDYKLKLSKAHSKILGKVKEYREYHEIVIQETNRSLIEHKKDIPNYHLRGKKHCHDLDHKYSILKGFNNNVSPKIVGHWKNLEIMSGSKNRSKQEKCSIELTELLTLIGESEERK